MTSLEKIILIFALSIVFIQATWIFLDATKKGHNKWLWGFIGLIHFPSAIIIYLLITQLMDRKISCPSCYYSIPDKSEFCPYCGHNISDEEREIGKENYKNIEQKNR